jgi:hypothetical protein
MNDPAFRNCVKGGLDAAAALAALTATGGRLRLPDQGEVIKLSSRVVATANGLELEGSTHHGTGGTVFQLDATNAGIDFQAANSSGIRGAIFKGSVTVLPTSGAALAFIKSGGNCYGCFAENLQFEKVFDGIDVNAATNTRLMGKIEIRDIHGTFGVRMFGSSLANRADYLQIRNLICDTPYPHAATAARWKGARANSTSYSQGDIVTQGGCIYQCTVAGTTAGSGGPAGSHGTTGSRLIVDGTVTWQFICTDSLAWILQDSFAYSLDVAGGTAINGAYAFRMRDSVASGSSYPTWGYFTNFDMDHNAITGALCEAGEDFNAEQVWVSSCLSGNGVQWTSGYKGEGGFRNGQIRGNAQHGALINGGRGIKITGNDIVDNSQAASATYSGVAVAAGVSGFTIHGNHFLPQTPNTTQLQKYPVIVNSGASDGYIIAHNVSKGHSTSNTVQDGGTGVNKSVANNVAW